MRIAEFFERGREALGRVVVGNDEAIDGVLAALVLEGHVLLEGPPGTAKTLLARSLAHVTGLDFARIQFTPDLMPADLTGTMVFVPQEARFELRKGPVFASLVLADEINRTPPKTQAALLEAMEEGRVTIEGQTLDLPRPFVVCATENPIEFEGTYPLPEAQLDRFLFKLLLAYPDIEAEREILRRHQAGFRPRDLARMELPAVVDAGGALALQEEAAAVTVHEDVLGYAAEVAAWLRGSPDVIVGPSPRGSIALVMAARVMAAARAADYVTPDDLQALAPAVLRHRIVLSTDAELGGRDADAVVAGALSAVPVPR
ncbi:MAG: AAA family ATPase [Gaiellales bacterium]|nr:MoxR family ATPase [Gaiellales bacterium]